MFRNDYNILKEMNIQTDAIIINQCDRNRIEPIVYNNQNILWIDSTTRGIGKSRNLGILYSTGDIIQFADDDVVFKDGYQEIVLQRFQNIDDSSLLVFNFQSLNPLRPEYIDQREKKLNVLNCLKYGAFRIAVKRETLLKKNIWFSLLFGGGAQYQAGEDNLFITTCIQRGMKCVACDEMIGTVKQQESTWFKGYNEKYYYDRGALFKAMYGKKAIIYLGLITMKELLNKKSNLPVAVKFRNEIKGANDYRLNHWLAE